MNVTPSTLQYIRDHADDDIRELALKGHRDPSVDVPFALDQIRGRQEARTKLPSWAAVEGLFFPPHLSMEQCSSESTGRYKQWVTKRLMSQKSPISSLSELPRLFSLSPEVSVYPLQNADTEQGRDFDAPAPFTPVGTMTDLTGGFGVDFSFLSRCFASATYVEQQSQLCDLARHNFPLLGLSHASVVNKEAEQYLSQMSPVDLIFMDPARRNAHGGRTYGIADCTPNVLSLLPQLLSHTRWLLLKLSPMLDVHAAVDELNHAAGHDVVREVHVVAVANECKELLVVLGDGASVPLLFCANCPQPLAGGLLRKSEARQNIAKGSSGQKAAPLPTHPSTLPGSDGPAAQVFVCQLDDPSLTACPVLNRWPEAGDMLFEPNASLMKAGCFGPLSRHLGLSAVGVNSHLFVASATETDLPGRRFVVDGVSGLGRRAVKSILSDIDSANVSVRNFPMQAVQLRKRLRLKDGGDVYLFGTTAFDRQHIIILCHKFSSPLSSE